MKQNKRFLLISCDAMIYEDLAYASTLPSFRRLMENGSRVNRVRSIYPTLTYPCHTTMLSGCMPDRHGICNNEMQAPGQEKAPWLWYHEPVRVPDLMDVCKAAGYTTASVSWPVTGRHPSVDWLVDEIWSSDSFPDTETAVNAFCEVYLDAGTSPELLESCVRAHMAKRILRTQPETGWFSTKVLCGIIRNYRPEVMALHIAPIDTYRHASGVFGPHVEKGLRDTDEMLSEILDALKDAGILGETDIVVTSDHGQIDTDRKVAPNVLFRDAGLIRTDSDGNVTDWDAWCFSAGASAQIRLRDPSDTKLREDVYALLSERLAEGDSGFSDIFTEDDLRKDRLAGDFSFVLESDGHTGFSASWNGGYMTRFSALAGKHGYHPDRGPSPTLICCGPSFRKGVVLERAELADGAPTWAELLGVELPNADGRILRELLK